MATPALTRITEQDADQESERLFAPPAAIPAASFPRRTYQISVLSPLGYPITVIYTDITLDRLSEAEANLMEHGYMPAEVSSVLGPNAPAPAAAQHKTPGAIPVCQYHGPMKESTIKGKEGTYYCSKKMADDSYCKERG